MKLIIAGTRSLEVPDSFIESLVKMHRLQLTEVVSGACGFSEGQCVSDGPLAKGIDGCGEYYARSRHLPIVSFYANWGLHGKSAGPLRNKAMASYADALLLIWDGKSRGSNNMRKEMLKLCKPVYSVVIEAHNV